MFGKKKDKKVKPVDLINVDMADLEKQVLISHKIEELAEKFRLTPEELGMIQPDSPADAYRYTAEMRQRQMEKERAVKQWEHEEKMLGAEARIRSLAPTPKGVKHIAVTGNCEDIGDIVVTLDLENGERIEIPLGSTVHPDQIDLFRNMAETGLGNVDRPSQSGSMSGMARSQAFNLNAWSEHVLTQFKENTVMASIPKRAFIKSGKK